MKLLVDTNIVVPLEPTNATDVEVNTAPALELARLASLHGDQLYIHPELRTDLARDRNDVRKTMRGILVGRYPDLPFPPAVAEVESLLQVVAASPHDRVDHFLLAAVRGDAVDYLVTEDQGIHRKARRLGLDGRVLTLASALDLLRDLYDTTARPPPYVRAVAAHALNPHDPIFDSFRVDYTGFDAWLSRVRREHRVTWLIEDSDSSHAAFCIVNPEMERVPGLDGRVLKICSFKVAEKANGSKFGELLLKAVFEHAYHNRYDGLFTTVFPRHAVLINLLRQFGFERVVSRPNGEDVLVKRFAPSANPASVDALEYHVKYGPRAVRSYGDRSAFVIPIRPEYHEALFPDAGRQVTLPLGQSKPFGNAIRKAYLCNAKIRRVEPGDNLLFYRSQDARQIACTGVVEAVRVSQESDAIAGFVGTRTVYAFPEIERMCRRGAVLALLFRHSRTLTDPLSLLELCAKGVLKAAPQSIVTVGVDGRRWLEECLVSQP